MPVDQTRLAEIADIKRLLRTHISDLLDMMDDALNTYETGIITLGEVAPTVTLAFTNRADKEVRISLSVQTGPDDDDD